MKPGRSTFCWDRAKCERGRAISMIAGPLDCADNMVCESLLSHSIDPRSTPLSSVRCKRNLLSIYRSMYQVDIVKRLVRSGSGQSCH